MADHHSLVQLTKLVLADPEASPSRRLRTLVHTVLGAALADELAPFGVEHIHAHHGYFSCWMALAAAQLLGIGFSFTLHGSDLLLRGDLLQAKLRCCKFCVTVSEFNRQYILDHYPETSPAKILVSRLGVNPPESAAGMSPVVQASHDLHPFVMLAVGRLHTVKNFEFLIDACALLRDAGKNFTCIIAGDGPERAALERQIRVFRLERHVSLLGYVPHDLLPGFYRGADLVVLTSRSEGIPVALMEAMAYERLVLAPAITGIPELVQHGRTGFLYEPGSLADFLGALEWIHDRRDDLGEIRRAAARSVAASYNRQTNVSQFASQFLTLISGTVQRDHEDSLLQQVQLPV
jgi:colanic acid/amylovoran biosynthesis glycosyltransferase